ncbi:hypothetical protein FF38_02713 [Lucilia cuprina]|uniref:MADF domain-containing protein n=1 Tax=Lucilia cuprina TaxID=7375 RepID=A0A0L0CMN9_LUCCU|nr:hypothetical protein FF38_02713 [Lucilia cuprina]
MMISLDLEEKDDNNVVADKIKNIKKNLNFKKKLILQVRKHRLLYDNKSKFFSNVAKKELVWQQIASELKSNADDCKSTWFDLRYGYQRHARRLHNFFITGQKENRKRPAMYLESELMFLWRFIGIKKSCNLDFEISEIDTLPETATQIQIEVQPESQVKAVTQPEPEVEEIDVDENADVEEIEVEVVQTPEEDQKEQEIEIQKNKENESKDNAAKQKTVDDDLILVEQPVELIVIEEDDDNNKAEKQFNVTNNMKILIQEIKKYPELYDSENLAFKDYSRKSYIWNAIAVNVSDKATKLMKCWIIMQTRYEWELCQAKQQSNYTTKYTPSTELQVELEFLKDYILNNPDTVYKQSFYLKNAWYDPIDYFKDIYNLIVRMKKMSDIVYITDAQLKSTEKTKSYLTLWNEIANLKGCSAGQCETTWLIMRYFYWELMNMRQHNYQLTDKWYFETIITELYAISKAAQASKQQELQLLKQNKPTKKATKRSAQTPSTTLGAPSTTRPAITATSTMSMTPTIINNLHSVPATNSTQTTQSSNMQPISFPKITAAISLAPQSLNTGAGTLQIKPIPGPPNLSPAPHQIYNGMTAAVPVSVAPTSAMPAIVQQTQIPMSFNLPAQTKVTTVSMPQLIRPLTSNTTTAQSIIRTTPQITVRPKTVIRPAAPNIMPPKIHITPLTNLTTPTNNTSIIRPQIPANIQPLTSLNNSNTIISTAAVPLPTPGTSSISSLKITTVPIKNLMPNTTVAATTIPATSSTAMTTANNQKLPKISNAISLLNPNEILIELIASQNGNQLVVHGPPLSARYQLSMPTVAKFIREVLAIPLLHNKRCNQPNVINNYWDHIGRKFNLPVHICRACWNFLLENFNHFPQIAPLKELMRPFQTSLSVWVESHTLFKKFDEHCVSKGWLQYMKRLPEVVECISGYPVLYQDVTKDKNSEKFSDMETLCAWRTISLRFPKITGIQEIWASIKTCFCQYMTDLEFAIDNKWPINWWRALARLKFLVEARYTSNEPFYYIVSNKMVEEIERCAMLEMKNRYKNDNASKTEIEKLSIELEEAVTKTNDVMASFPNGKKEVELGSLITAIQKHPVILGKADNVVKYEAWKKVAKELRMEVTDCLLAFKHATQMYYAYKKQDPVSRCRINERYYKKFDEIVRNLQQNKTSSSSSLSTSASTSSRCKLNIKTPFELNHSLESEKTSNSSDSELVFPERYISDISMSNSPSTLVVKNWVYAIGNLGTQFNENHHVKLKSILNKYLPHVKWGNVGE